jgi:small GTP-binding protein
MSGPAGDFVFKVIVVGDGGCGKTALVVRLTQNLFKEKYEMTIGVDFSVKRLEIGDSKVKLHVWDTAGQEFFANVRPGHYKGAKGALCVFDLTSLESFDHSPEWLEEIKEYAGDIPVLLVGNKSDLPERDVTREEAEAFAQQYNLHYMETSAKTGENVGDCFKALASLMLGLEPVLE